MAFLVSDWGEWAMEAPPEDESSGGAFFAADRERRTRTQVFLPAANSIARTLDPVSRWQIGTSTWRLSPRCHSLMNRVIQGGGAPWPSIC
jgi:hypothetical protein